MEDHNSPKKAQNHGGSPQHSEECMHFNNYNGHLIETKCSCADDIKEETAFLSVTSPKDLKQLTSSCIENAMAFFMDWIPNIITLYYINYYTSQEESSGFGLGLVWSNSIGQGLYYGLSSGFETLAAHAHGLKNYELVGILYQRTLFIGFLLFIPVVVFLVYTENILLMWNSDQELCRQAASYCISVLPGLFFAAIAFQFKASLNAQNIYNLQYQAVALSVPFHWLLCSILIANLELSVIGGGIAFSLSQLASLLTLYYLVKRKEEYQKCYVPFDRRCMQDLIPFLKVVVPIGSLLTLEWVVYEAYSIIASNLSPAQYSAHIVLANFNTIYYQFPEGYSIATSTFVGNEMGSNKPNRAKRFAKYGLFITVIHFIATFIPLALLKAQIISQFSVDDEVEVELQSTFYLFLLAVIQDSSQVMLTGLMRAIGQEHFSSISFIFSYAFIGIFSSYILAYNCELELEGIWFGSILGTLSYNFLQVYQMQKQDWAKLAVWIQDRVGNHLTQEDQFELMDIKNPLLIEEEINK